ncbi:hypothetical protein COCC4DRAFT_29057 [Bipolaris maydis ATCC 48331]|uniref:Uncharacterized protein n=1 Tax=Cochliobolus heterostrophus (strain C4 / ATCC 48331 / race T) TaxID=665024 RepID=N4WW93_COCH4|nr:uncharacterized protein COCC4DRAFT_29057 [Bipolaris maydis ATCC 48331]ENH98645.1 hypothetical protein COCC4DRAFT_29057 [Bipolaris maydis ATCC 48331]
MRISVFTFASVITTMMHIATVNAFTCSYYCGNDTNPAEFHPGLTDSCCGSQGNYDINGNFLQVVAREASSIYVFQRVRMVRMHVAQTITLLNATSYNDVTSLPYIRPILELD